MLRRMITSESFTISENLTFREKKGGRGCLNLHSPVDILFWPHPWSRWRDVTSRERYDEPSAILTATQIKVKIKNYKSQEENTNPW